MDKICIYLTEARHYLDFFLVEAEKKFNSWMENIDFGLFCFIYVIILVFLLRKWNKPKGYRPQNMELVGRSERIKKGISTFFVGLPLIRSYVASKLDKQWIKNEKGFFEDMESNRDKRKSKVIPTEGMNEVNLKHRIAEWSNKQDQKTQTGKISGTIYVQKTDINEEAVDFASKYMYHNPLHLDTFKELGRLEAEVLKMTASLVSENRVYGLLTSGGSESLIMLLYAYKKYHQKEEPNIVVPNTAHAAIDKGATYFNIQVRKAKLTSSYQVDVKHMESLIDKNTILLIGSYPNYPHGICDPIHQIAKLAKKKKVGFHIDGCLGGFVAAFLKDHMPNISLDIDGVTSISLDHHKFGLAPKGVSCVIYKHKQLRSCQYYVNTDWLGGVYATPSFPGSRSGFATAGAWYMLTHVGKKVYQQNSKAVVSATINTAEKLRKIDGIQVLGEPSLCVLAFISTTVDIYLISTYLTKNKHWKVSPVHRPNAIHLSVTLANCKAFEEQLADDVSAAIDYILKNDIKASAMSALYGISATLPSNEMGDDILKKAMTTGYKTSL